MMKHGQVRLVGGRSVLVWELRRNFKLDSLLSAPYPEQTVLKARYYAGL